MSRVRNIIVMSKILFCFTLVNCGSNEDQFIPNHADTTNTQELNIGDVDLPELDEDGLINYPVTSRLPLFEPMGDQTMLIVGQDMVAIGGIVEKGSVYDQGYMDDPELDDLPVGLTTYLHIQDNRGLTETFNNLGEVKNAKLTVNHTGFSHTTPLLSIGYFISNDYEAIQSGKYDRSLHTLANWIVKTNVPTFLRIGYEFNAEWTKHPLDPKGYINTFRYIVSQLDAQGVKNCAYVWQTDGIGNESELLKFYPGDEFVDWMAYSHFKSSGEGLLSLALKHKKPVMIAEATPVDFDLSKDNDADGQRAWTNWFSPLFKRIDKNPNIRMLAYINDDWDAKSMWQDVEFFNQTDSRIQLSEKIKQEWISEITDGTWFKQEEVLKAIGWE